jgi:hypothetical protein
MKRQTLYATCLIFIAILFMGCEKREGEQRLDSPEALGRAVVDALNRRDVNALHRLRVGKEEYLSWLWPAFPASRQSNGFPPDFAWSNLNKKCLMGVEKWSRMYGGQELSFVSLRFEKASEKYKGFRLLRGTTLIVKRPDGNQTELKILGSLVESAGRYKLLSYED